MLALTAAILGAIMTQSSSQFKLVEANEWNFVSVQMSDLSVIESGGRKQMFVTIGGHSISELIPSWTGKAQNGSSLTFFVRPETEGAGEFSLGTWSEGVATPGSRSSVNDQEDDFSKVITDTLILKKPVDRITVRIEATPAPDGTMPELKDLSFVLTSADPKGTPNGMALWNTLLDVPQRAQSNYEGGGVLCSPTSVSMILAYWSKKLNKPELDNDVPIVQACVYDPGWNGTGNWPFNVAFAGSQPGMTGYVTRFRSIQDIEAFVGFGVPIATSVSYGLLKGVGKQDNDGHLVVVVGFDKDGDPIFNDPGRNIVRLTYKRADFEKAWGNSNNTVYVIHPRGWKIPKNGPWPEQK
ncbi:MAG: C39 family peptidase [Fimbriimonadaceae bacterium]